MTPPVALTIAGSDSGGGAGVQADLRVFACSGVFGTSAITAVTAQSTLGVDDVHVVPRQTLSAQLDAVLTDLPPAAVKTGMLATAELAALVADRAEAGALPGLVVDPVLVAASGDRLLDDDALAVYRDRLFPLATVITPNLLEAEVLTGRRLTTVEDARAAARELAADGPDVVVVKGGHLDGPDAVDVVVAGQTETTLSAPRVETRNTHGTGCTFAAATAAAIARGVDPLASLEEAKRYVTACLRGSAAWQLGSGHGPLDHLGISAVGPAFVGDRWR